MRRALRLARCLGRTWPNPGVGCVLVRDGRLIGQGRHERCGEAHAEVMALATRRGARVRAGATATSRSRVHAPGPPAAVRRSADRRRRRPRGARSTTIRTRTTPARGSRRRHRLRGRLDAAAAERARRLPRAHPPRPAALTGNWAMTLDGAIAAAGGDANGSRRPRRWRCRAAAAAPSTPSSSAPAPPRQPVAVRRPRRAAGPVRVVLSASGAPRRRAYRGTAARTPTWVVHRADAEPRAVAELARPRRPRHRRAGRARRGGGGAGARPRGAQRVLVEGRRRRARRLPARRAVRSAQESISPRPRWAAACRSPRGDGGLSRRRRRALGARGAPRLLGGTLALRLRAPADRAINRHRAAAGGTKPMSASSPAAPRCAGTPPAMTKVVASAFCDEAPPAPSSRRRRAHQRDPPASRCGARRCRWRRPRRR